MIRSIVAACFCLAGLACSGGSDGEPDVRPQTSGAEQLGREVGETYLLLIDDAEAMLGLNLPAEQLRPALRMLKEDYRVRFANLGCLREELDEVDRAQVGRIADDYVQINAGQDTSWLTQARQRYAGDSEIPSLLSEIEGLRIYAFFDQLARVHPGDTVLCEG